MSDKLYKMMMFFKDHIRSRLPATIKSEKLFLTLKGDALRSNSLPRIISTSMSYSGHQFPVSCTAIRKMHTTVVNIFFVCIF